MIARAALVLAVAGAGCTVTEQVLGDDTAPITTCSEVWLRGVPDAACSLTSQCLRDDPVNPMCCQEYAYCRMGELVMGTNCNPDCSTCVDDLACTFGAATCNGMACAPCAFTPDPTGQMCPNICPPGWGYLSRNGCPTCECAPPAECASSPNMPMPGPGCTDPMEVCYAGNPADPGCLPSDTGCAPSTCSAAGCPLPAKLGCFTACDMMMPGCNQCATTSCECVQGSWVCQPICIDGLGLSLSCTYP